LHPCAYHISNGELCPLEFSTVAVATPKSEFLAELAQLLNRHNLGGLLGLSHLFPRKKPWLETISMDKLGTVTQEYTQDLSVHCEQIIITEWAIDAGGGAHFTAVKACEKQENGGHSRT
jgi:hypothetical protein